MSNAALHSNGMNHAGLYPNASAHHVSRVAPAFNAVLATAVPTVVLATAVPPSPPTATTVLAKNKPVRALTVCMPQKDHALGTAVMLPFAPVAHLGLPAPVHFGSYTPGGPPPQPLHRRKGQMLVLQV